MLRKLYYFYNSSTAISIGLDEFKFTAIVITVHAKLNPDVSFGVFLWLKDRLLKCLQQ